MIFETLHLGWKQIGQFEQIAYMKGGDKYAGNEVPRRYAHRDFRHNSGGQVCHATTPVGWILASLRQAAGNSNLRNMFHHRRRRKIICVIKVPGGLSSEFFQKIRLSFFVSWQCKYGFKRGPP